MIDRWEIFRSVGDVWLLWMGSCLVLLGLLFGYGPRFKVRPSVRSLLRREHGATYSLVFVMVFPIFLLLVCLVVETTLVLMVKTGTVYAAYAAARSQCVWSSAIPNLSSDRSRIAAVQALTPFAASAQHYAAGAGVVGPPSQEAMLFCQAYRQLAEEAGNTAYVMAKYRFAERATNVESLTDDSGDVSVEVTYEMPLHVPGVGRIIGQRASWSGAKFFTRVIRSRASLPEERPVGPSKTLGIDYVSE